MADNAKKLRDMREAVEQSDSGMRRSDETKSRLRDLDSRIRQSESAGAGRGGQGGPTAKELQEEPMTSGQKQSMQEAKDEEDYQKRKTAPTTKTEMGKAFAKGGMTSSASKRADGCATKGKTKGRFV
jgi:hypothetical protein